MSRGYPAAWWIGVAALIVSVQSSSTLAAQELSTRAVGHVEGSTAPEAAQQPPASETEASTAADAQPEENPIDLEDASIDRAQPDFTLVALPTTLRLPRFKSAFRVTHRFSRPLGAGDFGDLVADLFGLDSGAGVGLEYRFGLARGLQAGIYRTNGRRIQFFGQYSAVRQTDTSPLAVDALLTVEGRNNFREEYSPGLGLLISHKIGEAAALYLEPLWIGNTNPLPDDLADDNNTILLGLGARIRVASAVYLVGELAPRLAGYDPGNLHGSFGIERRAGGHLFQLNFSNSLNTTPAGVARGGPGNDDWFIGFNISRKFF